MEGRGLIAECMNGWMMMNGRWWIDERSDSCGDSVRRGVGEFVRGMDECVE